MERKVLKERAERFRILHHGPPILVLPNAWDAASARLFELEGFQALATTSGGISASLGYPDGEHMSLSENVSAVQRIAHVVQIPVSADIEAGYGRLPRDAARAAWAVMKAGAVGINLEDRLLSSIQNAVQPLISTSEQARRITAVRKTAQSEGISLFINARTDTYLLPDNLIDDRFSETVRRAQVYVDAGADCIFVPDSGTLTRDIIAELVRVIRAPISIIAGAGTPPIRELEKLGVARVSFGPRPMRACLGLLKKMAREWREDGTYATMTDTPVTYQEVNGWFAGLCGKNPAKTGLRPSQKRT